MDLALVPGIGITEFLQQVLLFHPDLPEKGEQDQEQSDHGNRLSDDDHGAGQTGQNPGIDRVPHVPVRAVADQFVANPDCGHAAPVLTQVQPCPDREPDAGKGDDGAGEAGDKCVRYDPPDEKTGSGRER